MNYEAFKAKCKERGYSPCRFVDEKLGISKSNITNWKNGGNPSYENLIKMSKILECSIDYLLGNEENVDDYNFWTVFCKLSEDKGIKPHRALKDMDISSGSADNWKYGSIPNGKILIKIAKYFDTSIDSMLGI